MQKTSIDTSFKSNKELTDRKISKDGYVIVKKLENGKTKWVLEHRYLMEKEIGRKLRRDEIIHHKNGIKHDNRISNLEIITSSKHSSIHHDGNSSKTKSALSPKKPFRKWTNLDYWNFCLEKYRVSKMLREILRLKKLTFVELGKEIGFTRQYVYQTLKMIIEPNKEFVRKIKAIHKEVTNEKGK